MLNSITAEKKYKKLFREKNYSSSKGWKGVKTRYDWKSSVFITMNQQGDFREYQIQLWLRKSSKKLFGGKNYPFNEVWIRVKNRYDKRHWYQFFTPFNPYHRASFFLRMIFHSNKNWQFSVILIFHHFLTLIGGAIFLSE